MKHCLICGKTFEQELRCPRCNEPAVDDSGYDELLQDLKAASAARSIPAVLSSPPPRRLKRKESALQRLSTYIFVLFMLLIVGIIVVHVIHDLVVGGAASDLPGFFVRRIPAFALALGFVLLVKFVTRKSRTQMMEDHILSNGIASIARVAEIRNKNKHQVLIVRFINEEGRIRSGAVISSDPFEEKAGDLILWMYTPGKFGAGLYVDESLLAGCTNE